MEIKSRDRIAAEGRAAAENDNPANPYPAGTEAHDVFEASRSERAKELA